MTWRTYLISFPIQYCFLFRFACIELFSLIWFLHVWVAFRVYGTMINWFTLIKKLMETSIVIVSGSIINASTVHLHGIWHLIWRYILKPVLGGHPVLSRHYSIPWGCPLNAAFTVFRFFSSCDPWCRIQWSYCRLLHLMSPMYIELSSEANSLRPMLASYDWSHVFFFHHWDRHLVFVQLFCLIYTTKHCFI